MKTECVIVDKLGSEIPEWITFRDRRVAKSGLHLVVARNEVAFAGGTPFPNGKSNRVPDGSLPKKDGLQHTVDRRGLRAVMVGVRRNAEPTQAKERAFNSRTATREANAEAQPPEMGNNSRRFPAIAGWPVIQWRTPIQTPHQRIQS